MAFGAKKIFPIDTVPSVAVGVDIPFNAPAVFKSNYLTKDAIRNNLINFYSTDPGERVFNPFFGSGLKKYVFENIDTLTNDFIKKIVTDEINQYFPFVQVAQITTTISEDINTITINLKYQVINNGIQDEINITI